MATEATRVQYKITDFGVYSINVGFTTIINYKIQYGQ